MVNIIVGMFGLFSSGVLYGQVRSIPVERPWIHWALIAASAVLGVLNIIVLGDL